jgi:hypothetical protein
LKTAYCMDEDMIGMALGSPSHPPFVQSNVHDQLQAATAYNGTQAHPEAMVEAKSSNAKAGKWKKFGGLFKPKHNPSIQAAPAVPQLSQHQNAGQNIDATASRPLPLPKDTPKIDQTLGYPEPTPIDSLPIEGLENSTVTLLRTQLPKLEVDIPDVQMDRYSVMFGSLLGGQQSANLLSRRSKILERLKTSSDENVASQDPLHLQKQLDNAGLTPNMAESEGDEQLKPPPSSSRRATSPTPGKSPLFSLFPQPPTTPRRAAAVTSQGRPSPLQRSFTAPSRLSPNEETFGIKRPQLVKPNHIKRRKSSISLVETSASTTQGPGWSTDVSYLSPNSSVSTVGDEILFDIKKLSMVTENQEPQYEVTKPDGETVELYRAISKKVRAAKPPPLKLSSKYANVEGTNASTSEAYENILSSLNAAPKSTGEGPNNVLATNKSLDPEYLLPATHFIPTTKLVEATKEQPTPEADPTVAQVSKPPAEVEKRLIPEPSQPMAPISDSPIEVEESAEASQDILAAAVMGTLDDMGEQSSVRAASPMPESPGLRVATPEKPVKLLVIPKNIPISKYSLRSPTAAPFKEDPVSRSSSPQPRRVVTEPLMPNQSFAARATKLQAAPVVPNSRVKKSTTKPNSSSKIVSAHSKGNTRTRGPKPGLSIVPPKSAAVMDTPNSALSPVEVTVAREVSLSRKQSKKLLIPPSGRRIEGLGTDNGEKVVNTQALMPVIIDANKAHRPGKSLALVIENA